MVARARRLPHCALSGHERWRISFLRRGHPVSCLPDKVRATSQLLADLCNGQSLRQQTSRQTLFFIQERAGL